MDVWLPLVHASTRAEPTTQACAPTRNRTGDPLLRRRTASPLSHPGQGSNSSSGSNRCLWDGKQSWGRRGSHGPSPRSAPACPPLCNVRGQRRARSFLRITSRPLPTLTTGPSLFQGEYEAALTIYDDHVSPCLHTRRVIAAV